MYDDKKLVLRGDATGKLLQRDRLADAEDSEIVSLFWQTCSMISERTGKNNDVVRGITKEVFLINALKEIDNALIGLRLDGGGVVASIEAANALSNAIAIDSGDERLAQARRQLAYQGALEKLKRDPKQKEKQFIRECWRKWQTNPAAYSSKAAFARDMLTKCVHLTSQKKIEDWCREWDSGDGTQQAQ